ncbi:MAG: RNA pyrophosphohydrolase [Oligoflexales bacterium]
MSKEKKYRPCVVAVIRDAGGLVLVGERKDAPGCWQLPQGGVDHDENTQTALCREVLEETACKVNNILFQSEKLYKYDFPEHFKARIAQDWVGQEQTWFVCTVLGEPDAEKAQDQEFAGFQWMNPQDVQDQIVEFKRNVYREAFADISDYL